MTPTPEPFSATATPTELDGLRARRRAIRRPGSVDRGEAAIVERLPRRSREQLLERRDPDPRDDVLAHGHDRSSMRMYNANAAIPPAQLARRVEVPSGFALFPGDILHPTREWLDRTANTVHVSEPPRGGHFAAFEEPELYAQELRDFFRPTREWLDRTANTVHVSEPPRGGHFAAFEEPELYAQELRDFFRPFRSAADTA
ncbi:alpha/beta fold hydrolase [Agreia bicolorata]|uniref:alpha/beta fold hydrolase n=1 Tax=Agreia bicolorata TaxID=110935 RepID=UPI001C6FCCDF|nr:hypothetical protein [Agreia bicolorata]